MKKIIYLLYALILLLSLTACGSSNYNNNHYSKSNYDYDKGYGYTKPNKGESLSDYIKRQDPDLYNNIKERYNNLAD